MEMQDRSSLSLEDSVVRWEVLVSPALCVFLGSTQRLLSAVNSVLPEGTLENVTPDTTGETKQQNNLKS